MKQLNVPESKFRIHPHWFRHHAQAHEPAPQQADTACCHSAYALIERDKSLQ
jgi:hypothetical protein